MIARTPAKPTRASTQLDPEVEKWLDKHAIATGKSDMNLVVTDTALSSDAPKPAKDAPKN